MQPQIVKEDSGSGLGSPDGNDILLEEETSELPKSIPGRKTGLVDFMSNLDVSHVGVARAIPTYAALQGIGSAFRNQETELLYRMSVRTDEFDEFWSHSWQLSPWPKIICLLFLKNGLAAGLTSNVAALTGCILSYFGVLPVVFGDSTAMPCYLWSQLGGILCFFPVLLLWRRHDRIFLDAGCINQSTPKAKTEGIRSMGGLPRMSRRMLVLWDVTYVERLWCMFELAAFMKSRSQPNTDDVVIRPTLLGSCALTIFVSFYVLMLVLSVLTFFNVKGIEVVLACSCCSMLVMYCTAAVYRGYFHSVQLLHEQLANFRLADSKCYCCSSGHVSSSGRPIMCDREIVTQCVGKWFGDEEQFEAAAHTCVSKAFSEQLGMHMFPLWLLLVVSSPFLWVSWDMAVSHHAIGDHEDANFWCIASMGYWLGAVPTCLAWAFYVASKLRTPCGARSWDCLANLLVIAASVPVAVVTFGFPVLMESFFDQLAVSAAASSAVLVTVGLLIWFSNVFQHALGGCWL